MSMRTLETAITQEARGVTKNPNLRVKDLLEWSSHEMTEIRPGEVKLYLPVIGIWIVVAETHNKRPKPGA